MRSSLFSDNRIWLYIAVGLLICFLVTDCYRGKTRYVDGVVRQHVYHAPYLSTHCSTDKSGKTHCSYTYHPAEYHLLIYVDHPAHSLNLETSLLEYTRYSDNSHLVVGERLGKWTGVIYLKWIAGDRSADY
jgi:hypothetical protein